MEIIFGEYLATMGFFLWLSHELFSVYFRHKNEQMAAVHAEDAFFLESDFRITLGDDEPLFLSSSGQSGKQYYDLSLSSPLLMTSLCFS